MKDQFYIVDADVLITAKNRYYVFDLCPGFWESLIYHHQEGRIYSIISVRTEVFAGRQTEDLVQWAKGEVSQTFFRIVDTEDVMEAYNEIVEWVTGTNDITTKQRLLFLLLQMPGLRHLQEYTMPQLLRTSSFPQNPGE